MTFESWGHTTAQLLFKWKRDELSVAPSVYEGLNQHSTFVEFIDQTYGTTFSTGNAIQLNAILKTATFFLDNT